MKILYATKVGEPDYKEDLITEANTDAKLGAAINWAIANGFDRLRIVYYDDNNLDKPNFIDTINIKKG